MTSDRYGHRRVHPRCRRASIGNDGDSGSTVAKLIYTAMTSVDGFIEDEQGGFGWAEPHAEVHQFAHDHA